MANKQLSPIGNELSREKFSFLIDRCAPRLDRRLRRATVGFAALGVVAFYVALYFIIFSPIRHGPITQAFSDHLSLALLPAIVLMIVGLFLCFFLFYLGSWPLVFVSLLVGFALVFPNDSGHPGNVFWRPVVGHNLAPRKQVPSGYEEFWYAPQLVEASRLAVAGRSHPLDASQQGLLLSDLRWIFSHPNRLRHIGRRYEAYTSNQFDQLASRLARDLPRAVLTRPGFASDGRRILSYRSRNQSRRWGMYDLGFAGLGVTAVFAFLSFVTLGLLRRFRDNMNCADGLLAGIESRSYPEL